jgi:L-seryl-tRNA(Ser) seleniumtransferase
MTSPRDIPSIEQLRQRASMRALETRYGREALVEALRSETSALRDQLAFDRGPDDVIETIERATTARLQSLSRPSLRPVINATGVVIHTNLGRAPLSEAAIARIAALAAGYTNLEYDLEQGARGRRDHHAERFLCRLTGATAAIVVNNNAAGTLLSLAALAAGREVLISRGELVEIGGGFRVPDVMAQSGAILREVGTTNRTRVADYAAAISDRTGLILRVHPSNFRIEGFTERPPLDALVDLGRRFGIPVAEDLGSGYLGLPDGIDALRDEPDVRDSIRCGADVVMFSGDKLLGGPQAGILAGSEATLSRLRRHPLMRALRVDKLTYAALEATLEEYAAGRAAVSVPVVRMIAASPAALESRAMAIAVRLRTAGYNAEVIDGASTIGGGSAPGSMLPTKLIALTHPACRAAEVQTALRAQDPPVIARIENDCILIDLRTVAPQHDGLLADCIVAALHSLTT